MFSSLASFLFGSNTNCETNSETTASATASGKGEQRDTTKVNLVDVDNLKEVTSLTPSVTSAGDKGQRAIKSGRNKRNNARQQNKRGGIKAPLPLKPIQVNSENSEEEDLDEDDWFIVEKELEEENVSPTCTDSEGENVIPLNEVAKTTSPIEAVAGSTLPQQRHAQNINSHSLYSGPRPQKQRNFLQKNRSINRPSNGLSVSTLSPSRIANDGHLGCGHEAAANGTITDSLCMDAAVSQQNDEQAAVATNSAESINKMEESWFVTPPPCFTSNGPVNMETSPFENLLIEHPSMSVYYSIKTAQEAAESFIRVGTGIKDAAKKQKAIETTPKKNPQAVQTRSSGPGYRLDRQTVAQLKQELMARNVQKVQTKNERKDICRTAMKRANKARDIQSKNHTKRRSDRQHSKIFSNANNNRKSNNC